MSLTRYTYTAVSNEIPSGTWVKGEPFEGQYFWRFDGVLAHIPVEPHSINITFGGPEYTVDDGEGKLFFGLSEVGEIDYETGALWHMALSGDDPPPNPSVDYKFTVGSPADNPLILQLFISGQPRVGGGTALTAIGDAVNQAVYWELVSYDPDTEEEGVALGSLMFARTITDAAKRSKNYYFAPSDPAQAGRLDRVKIRIAHA